MEITSSTPDEIDLRLSFLKPWKATNDVTFTLVPAGDGTEVTWRMTGEQKGAAAVFGKVFTMDRLLGKDFEKGLARLKAAAES
jgi:carbon monoxide dehydrogenase subunit G